jgi:arabinose-5-phosphate isomerase
MHPAEAVHGDLGCLHADDVLLALSNSGETEELTRLLPSLHGMQIPLIVITATDRSTLGSKAEIVISLGRLREAGPHGLAPTTSTTAMLAVGDALALVVSRLKGFTPLHFATLHPAGSLGRKLKSVTEAMRPLE